MVLVRPGGRVPADGVVVDGEAELDEAMVTGESRPVPKTVGDRVVAGTVSTDSTLRVRVDAIGEDTALGGIQRLVAEAQASRLPGPGARRPGGGAAVLRRPRRRAHHLRRLVRPLGDGDYAVVRTISVLVVACPHALGLAIPLTISLSTAVAAKAGILVKDRLALERMRTIDTILFDKTGTLTKGEHVVSDVAVAGDPPSPTRPPCCASPARSRPTPSTPWPGPSSPPPANAAPIPTASRVPGADRTGRASRRRRR